MMKEPKLEAVYPRIAELDPGEDNRPITDTVLVARSISVDEMRSIRAPLRPFDVGRAANLGTPKSVTQKHGDRVLGASWD